ncbi:hypothetical protein GCM10028792_07280 [Salinisphaera aquimarina]
MATATVAMGCFRTPEILFCAADGGTQATVGPVSRRMDNRAHGQARRTDAGQGEVFQAESVRTGVTTGRDPRAQTIGTAITPLKTAAAVCA